MMSIHATRKLLGRIKQQPEPAVENPSTPLGNWYATLIKWRKPVVLFVNARTRLPVLVTTGSSDRVQTVCGLSRSPVRDNVQLSLRTDYVRHMIEVKGVMAKIEFDGRSVKIIRGRMSTVGRGEKVIPVKSITAVQWKSHTITTRGYIQFTVPGGNESRSKLGSGTIDAANDENSVLFTKKAQPEFQALREAVETAIHGDATNQTAPPVQPPAPQPGPPVQPPAPQPGPPVQPPAPQPGPPAQPAQASVAQRLADLTALRDQGLVSPEQFEAKHEQILRDL